ncbi:MAG TPA: YiiX family permuted papain-like enzyme [Gammaproteobacteria bacterium]
MRLIIILMVVVQLPGCLAESDYRPRNGDIIFQTSRSSQSLAIQLATDSPYSHIGVVYILDDAPFVFEAVQPVKLTPLDEWVAQGDRGHFVVKRLRDADSVLSADKLAKMRSIGEAFVGRDYDLYFEWSDDRIYCSELVWKVFDKGAGIQLGELETFADFDFSHPAVQAKVKERFGDHLPMDEVVVSPAAIFEAPNLETVYRN